MWLSGQPYYRNHSMKPYEVFLSPLTLQSDHPPKSYVDLTIPLPALLNTHIAIHRTLTLTLRTLQKLRWHDTQVMPYLKPSMGDSTLHSVSVVAVVSERQGAQLQIHCAKRCDVSTVLNSMVCHNDPVRHFSRALSSAENESAWKLLCSCFSNVWSRRGSARQCIPMLVY